MTFENAWNSTKVRIPWMATSLPKLKPVKLDFEFPLNSEELNILILGETGVGKSTWINAFQNFLIYNSLDEAEAGNLATIIPSRFSLANDDLETIEIKTGSDENEILEVGKSATQGTRIHQFNVDNIIIRLIDTPGIGDVRGIEQDAENFKNILETVGQLKELHGICILLKPNKARLTPDFKFCVNELLRNLHKDASKNMLFCITNSKSTFFTPGETVISLKVILDDIKDANFELNKKTLYCFDNEAYRYLAALKNNPPFHFSAAERDDVKVSWDKSMEETQRLLKTIRELPPHQVRNTLSLYNAKSVIHKLVRPMSEVSRNIEMQIKQVEQERKLVQMTEENIRELQKCLNTTRSELEIIKLKFPKLVCSKQECMKSIMETKNKTTDIYRAICHDKCTAKGGGENTLGGFGLRRCKMIDLFGNCKVCKHGYKYHLQVFYESREVVIKMEDAKTKQILMMSITEKEKKARIIEAKTKLIKNLQEEHRRIYHASLKFACFSKINSIANTADAMECYLRHQIMEQEITKGKQDAVVILLRAHLEKYKKDKHALEQKMLQQSTGSELSTQQIVDEVNTLMDFPHSGKILREALDCIIRTSENIHQATVVHHTPGMKPQNTAANAETLLANQIKSLYNDI